MGSSIYSKSQKEESPAGKISTGLSLPMKKRPPTTFQLLSRGSLVVNVQLGEVPDEDTPLTPPMPSAITSGDA